MKEERLSRPRLSAATSGEYRRLNGADPLDSYSSTSSFHSVGRHVLARTRCTLQAWRCIEVNVRLIRYVNDYEYISPKLARCRAVSEVVKLDAEILTMRLTASIPRASSNASHVERTTEEYRQWLRYLPRRPINGAL